MRGLLTALAVLLAMSTGVLAAASEENAAVVRVEPGLQAALQVPVGTGSVSGQDVG